MNEVRFVDPNLKVSAAGTPISTEAGQSAVRVEIQVPEAADRARY